MLSSHCLTHTLFLAQGKNFLLYKKGDPHEPTSYKIIAVLNTPYKILASCGAITLIYYTMKYRFTNPTQCRGLPNHRTTDHIYSMIANLSIHPDIDHLYLDLNKAFNSIFHNALWCTTSRQPSFTLFRPSMPLPMTTPSSMSLPSLLLTASMDLDMGVQCPPFSSTYC